jgi:hypothetical protein
VSAGVGPGRLDLADRELLDRRILAEPGPVATSSFRSGTATLRAKLRILRSRLPFLSWLS